MSIAVKHQVDPVVRSNLNFKIDEIPKFWFANDPFKTRFFDALSLTFPEGERFFIESVRLFRDQIQDEDLQQKVKDFIRQEAQHGIAHDRMNQQMIAQGMPVEKFTQMLRERFQGVLKNQSAEYCIALTAASEHLTALMAECFFGERETMQEVHPYVRALLAWHSIEEMEHRDVAFDVMKDIAKVDKKTRKKALVIASTMMLIFNSYRTNEMLKVDGFSKLQRAKLFAKGLPWFLGRNGKLSKMKSQYLDWFKPEFHPSQHPIIAQYDIWIEKLAETGDPIQAGEAFWAYGR
ncbi:metal-dependent hydrolase [Acinetobacter terrestris]|uniref:Metal-dependent hydrolase n=1 Tax=Acinetobacter terrestris TaxID=2529843 RepID=A0AAW6UZS1_9GAMM|nr:metal-dependent hydrolase [Acinetobacter terrestris]MDK1685049.1 metal-dependent hydrolase [Acinetobacter terrestris]